MVAPMAPAARAHSARRAFLWGVAFVAMSTASGCAACRRLAGNDTINLEKSEMKSMSVDIRRQQKTICPREPVQMAIFAEVILDGEKAPKPLETWAGRNPNKNDKLDFADFAFQSAQGTFGPDGYFSPNPDLLLTVGKELEIKTIYRRRPDKFAFTTAYKPDYACIKETGKVGASGESGTSGNAGGEGKSGASGSSSSAGGTGGNGTSGSSGTRGGDGAAGPHYTISATIVKTPFYARVVALAISGDAEDFLLVPEDQPITIHAAGGPGGSGGSGGRGGNGGSGGSGNPGGNGGNGGRGGGGGAGGNGGPGGVVELMYDARFPDLKSQFKINVEGGAPGNGGSPGSGGSGGSGGHGQSPPSKPGQPSVTAASGTSGTSGNAGSGGNTGAGGTPGRATVTTGSVKEKLVRPEITPL